MTRAFLDIPAGINADETTTTVGGGGWCDGDKVRFHKKRPQTVGGWERMIGDLLTGVCRTVLPWTDRIGALDVAFGTHSKLLLTRGGALYDITPFMAPTTLPEDPLSVVNGSAVVTVDHPAHGLASGDEIHISGAAAVGGITPNGEFAITVVGANSYTFEFTSAATSGASGGGAAVVVAPQVELPAGAEHGTGTAGYSTGAYGVGAYSEPSTSDYFARTWALDTYGESLMASPRGGTVFWWQNDTSERAVALAGAPKNCSFMLVNEQRQVMAFGCNEEVSGVFNPLCIRYSDIENPEDWQTLASNNAGEDILKGGGRLVSASAIGPYLFVWTDNALYLGTFVGDPGQTWRFDLVGERCGLIGPNAAIVVGQTAYWPTPAGQFMRCSLGGAPDELPCTVRDDFFTNLAASQADKIVASSCAQFNEIRFDYPDARDGFENSRYVAACLRDLAWTRGVMSRSAYVDAGPSVSPIGVTPTGDVYWHERGHSADGEPLNWFLESADQYIDEDRRRMMLRDVEPDFEDQIGPIKLTVVTRDFAQGEDYEWEPVMLAAGQGFEDFRAEGRFIRTRWEGSGVPSFARFGRCSFDAVRTGQR